MSQHVTAAVIAAQETPGESEPLSWPEVRRLLDAERWYWLATADSEGRPHVRPVLAVCLGEDSIYSTTGPMARKGRNLQQRPICSLTARAPAVDIVVEGSTVWIDDNRRLAEVAAAYQAKYGWPVTITADRMFDAPYGAPTAGPPPYRVYQILPEVVYAFGTSDNLGQRSTRFRFDR